jgi:3-oxoacyl-[acyl-carrier protein] reductase
MKGTYLIVGASRGIGAAVAEHLAIKVDKLLTASRSNSSWGDWVSADVTTDQGIDAIKAHVGDKPLNGLLYLGGVWEENAFTDDYDFLASTRGETRNVIAVNLTAPILLAQALAPNLAKVSDPRIILMGSTSGLECSEPREIATGASKFGLRGAALSLQAALEHLNVGVTLINPEDVATEEVLGDIAKGLSPPQELIPMADIIRTIDYVLETSPASTPREINVFQRSSGC